MHAPRAVHSRRLLESLMTQAAGSPAVVPLLPGTGGTQLSGPGSSRGGATGGTAGDTTGGLTAGNATGAGSTARQPAPTPQPQTPEAGKQHPASCGLGLLSGLAGEALLHSAGPLGEGTLVGPLTSIFARHGLPLQTHTRPVRS